MTCVAVRSKTLGSGGNFAVESVATLPWNRRQLSRGISGSFHVESVATFAWNTHPSIDALLADLTRTALLVHPTMPLTVAPDEADNRFLECALEARAAFLVTGNLRHFPVATFEDIHILEPARFAHVLAERLRL